MGLCYQKIYFVEEIEQIQKGGELFEKHPI